MLFRQALFPLTALARQQRSGPHPARFQGPLLPSPGAASPLLLAAPGEPRSQPLSGHFRGSARGAALQAQTSRSLGLWRSQSSSLASPKAPIAGTKTVETYCPEKWRGGGVERGSIVSELLTAGMLRGPETPCLSLGSAARLPSPVAAHH